MKNGTDICGESMNVAVIQLSSTTETSQQRLDAMQDEVMQIQLKYQRELERLERENKELRKQMMLRGNQKINNRKIKVIRWRLFLLIRNDILYLLTTYFDQFFF